MEEFVGKFCLIFIYVAVFILLNRLDDATVELIFRFWLAIQLTSVVMTFITVKPKKKGENNEHN